MFVDSRQVARVADEHDFQPGNNAIALTYDFALKPQHAPIMNAVHHTSGKRVNRLTRINIVSGDLLNKLEAVCLICQETGCAQLYLTDDAMNAMVKSLRGWRIRKDAHPGDLNRYRVIQHDLTPSTTTVSPVM